MRVGESSVKKKEHSHVSISAMGVYFSPFFEVLVKPSKPPAPHHRTPGILRVHIHL